MKKFSINESEAVSRTVIANDNPAFFNHLGYPFIESA